MSTSALQADEAFVQGDITIVPPVRVETNNAGVRHILHWNDGGTQMINITDNMGNRFAVFFDYRFTNSTSQLTSQVNISGPSANDEKVISLPRNQGTIYLHDYPGRSNSVLVIDQKGFRHKILKTMEQESEHAPPAGRGEAPRP